MRSATTIRALAIAVSVSFGVAAAGCGAASVGEPEPAVQDGSWQLTAGTGPTGRIEAVDGYRITFLLEHGRVGGVAACNSYGARARIDGDRFALEDLAQTEMACAPDVMAAEAAYMDALQRADRIRRAGDQLILTGASVELRFDPLPPVPTSELIGTTWELETLIDGEAASSTAAPATLRLDEDGRIEGETGCRAFSGRYVLADDEVRVTQMTMQDDSAAGACAPETVEQERVVVDVLGDRFRADVQGDRLTLTGSGGRGLVYRSR